MGAGHATGFGRSLLEEDAVVQTSMGPIVDRSQEHLSGSDVAVAPARRMLLDALAAADAGALPPGQRVVPRSGAAPELPRCDRGQGQRWEDAALDQLTT